MSFLCPVQATTKCKRHKRVLYCDIQLRKKEIKFYFLLSILSTLGNIGKGNWEEFWGNNSSFVFHN